MLDHYSPPAADFFRENLPPSESLSNVRQEAVMDKGRMIGVTLALGLLMSSAVWAQGKPGGQAPPPPGPRGGPKDGGGDKSRRPPPPPETGDRCKSDQPPKTEGGANSTGSGQGSGVDGKGNNGVGNGPDGQPPGDPPVNDGAGTGRGDPGNKGGRKK